LAIKPFPLKRRSKMANGKIDPQLKQKIDDVQAYIDFLWEQGRDQDVPVYIRLKESLTKKID